MSAPDLIRLMAALDATWPAAELCDQAGWRLRRGAGGGKRVSAASLTDPAAALPDITAAENVMQGWGQYGLFRLIPDAVPRDTELGAALAERGYRVIDPVVIYCARIGDLIDGSDETARIIRVSTDLELIDEIWRAGGVGPERRAVMARSKGPGSVLMARQEDRPAGATFIACDREIAMIHAIEVLEEARRRGAGAMLLRGAASFGAEKGCGWLSLAVTAANAPARGLYEKLGMEDAGRYHYCIANQHGPVNG